MQNYKYDRIVKVNAFWLLVLASWFLLAFIGGIDELVARWDESHGALYWLALGLLINVFGAAFVCWLRLRWSHYLVIGITGIWLVVQVMIHWVGLIGPPQRAEAIEKYYTQFNTWYLLPPMQDRIVPDGYHTVLFVLLVICLYLGVRALFASLQSRNPISG